MEICCFKGPRERNERVAGKTVVLHAMKTKRNKHCLNNWLQFIKSGKFTTRKRQAEASEDDGGESAGELSDSDLLENEEVECEFRTTQIHYHSIIFFCL